MKGSVACDGGEPMLLGTEAGGGGGASMSEGAEDLPMEDDCDDAGTV